MEMVYKNPLGWALAGVGFFSIASAMYLVMVDINRGNLTKRDLALLDALKGLNAEKEGLQKNGDFICCEEYSTARFDERTERLMLEDLGKKCQNELEGYEKRRYRENGANYVVICAEVRD